MGLYNPPRPLYGTSTTLFRLIGANMNTTDDQQFAQVFPFTRYLIDRFVVANASVALETAEGGVYSAGGKNGAQLVPAMQNYSGLESPDKVIYPLLATDGQGLMTDLSIYLSLTVPEGEAATCDIYLMGAAGA